MEFLPEEILEIIFSYLSPYKEHNIAAMVCRKWNRVANATSNKLPAQFEDGLRDGNIRWSCIVSNDKTTVTPRIGHSLCYCDFTRSLYVFGGRCASNTVTGFNDLLRLDMHTLAWSRPVVKGVIPPPKHGCCMQAYKRWLVLFGGSSLVPTNSLGRGSAEYSNDLHIYDTKTGAWKYKTFLHSECPPPLFLPSSCVLADEDDTELDLLVVYGGNKMGLIRNEEMWCLNLSSLTWQKQTVNGSLPSKVFPDTSKGIFRVKIQAYSTALLIMDRNMFSAWILLRTGFNEWTYQGIEIAPSPKGYQPKINAISGRNFLVIGETLLVLAHTAEALPSHVPKLKTSTSNNLLSQSNSVLCVFLLDLKHIETTGTVQWIDQHDTDSKFLPSFIRGIHLTELHAVEGRGEIIFLGYTKMVKSNFMTLCTLALKT